jgi:hypothetical protein
VRLLAGIALIGAGALAAAAFWPSDRGEGAAPRAQAPEESGPGPAPAGIGAAEDLAPPAADVAREAAPVEPPPPAPEPDGIEDGGHAPAPEQDHSAKYAGLAPAELARGLADLEGRIQLECDREFADRFRSGRYVEHAVAPDDRERFQELLAAPSAKGWLRRARPVLEEPREGGATADVRFRAVQVVELPPDEFPALYALAAERDWLRRFLAPSGD